MSALKPFDDDPRVTRDASAPTRPLNKYSAMEDTVNEICRSLREEPLDWTFESNTFYYDKKPNIEYWYGMYNQCTELWRHGRHQVFSEEQGRRIYESIKVARLYQQDVNQKMVMEAMGTAPIEQKPALVPEKDPLPQHIKKENGFFKWLSDTFWK
jgi:hypothetical protein